jgi:arabinogalactan endo-1,4-beta-galactosidase
LTKRFLTKKWRGNIFVFNFFVVNSNTDSLINTVGAVPQSRGKGIGKWHPVRFGSPQG